MTARHFDLRHLESVPKRLRSYARRLRGLSIEGGAVEAERVVAIVGTRDTGLGAEQGTYWMAAKLAELGVVIASGGARGIDRAAHEGALSVGGITWAVLPCGAGRVYPKQNRDLFQRIVRHGGTLIYTFPPGVFDRGGFHCRNAVLASLSDVVVAAQAPDESGTHHTCDCAKQMNKPVWVVPPNPWMDGLGSEPLAEGGVKLLRNGAKPLYSLRPLLISLGLPVPERAKKPQRKLFVDQDPVVLPDPEPLTFEPLPERTDPTEKALVALLAAGAKHPDELVHESGLSSQAVSRALLTLTLDTVVVDGPDGRYRRCR